MADPFLPEKPADVKRLKELQSAIHTSFCNQVTSRRGEKLAKGDLFTGEIWVGQAGVDVGLADGIGHLVPTMKARFGEKTRFIVHQKKRGFFSRFGSSFTNSVLQEVEDRAHWGRFGL